MVVTVGAASLPRGASGLARAARGRYARSVFTIYRLNADELDASFLESLQAAFPHKEIEVAVAETDETAYLLRSPANRNSLLAAVADVEAGHHVVEPDQSAFR